jgi:hypothetical protein
LRRSDLVQLRIFGFLLSYLYEPGENPIEAFALNEAIKGNSWAIVQEHIPITNPHAKWFIMFAQGFVTGNAVRFLPRKVRSRLLLVDPCEESSGDE